MKKYCILLIILGSTLQLNAQTKGDWGEVFITVDNNLFFACKDLQLSNNNFYRPYISLGVDLRLKKELIGYLDIQLALTTAEGLKKGVNAFGELNQVNNLSAMEKYEGYKRENYSRFNLGMGYRFYSCNWRLIPQIGLGMVEFDHSSSHYLMKELGTNNIYAINYNLGSNDDRDPMALLYYLQFRLKAQKKISRKLSVNLAMSYNLYVDKLKFRGEYTDYYTHEKLKEISVSKLPHELSFSVGIGLR